jgi:hypothetical protein
MWKIVRKLKMWNYSKLKKEEKIKKLYRKNTGQ